jgi:hypothetical protein
MDNELRPFWSRVFSFNWKFGLFLILAVCIPRFLLVLIANTTGNYGSMGIVMFISAIVPFVFFNETWQKRIRSNRNQKVRTADCCFYVRAAFQLPALPFGRIALW